MTAFRFVRVVCGFVTFFLTVRGFGLSGRYVHGLRTCYVF